MRLSWGKVALGPFRAEDYEFRHGSPIFTPEDLEPSLGSTEWPLGGGAPSTAQRSASPQPTKPPSTQFAPTFTTLANASALSQRLLPTSQVEAEVLAVRKIQRDKAQDVQATRSRHTHGSVPQTTSITQPPTREVATRQPIEEHLMPEAETRAKTNKQQIKGRNKWWEMGGNLKSTKRHFRREAVDYGNPNSDYCNVEEFWEKARSLKRGGANKWRQPPPKHNSSKQVHGSKRASENQSIPGQQTLEPAPFSTATDAFKYHGRTLSSTSTGAAQAPLATARQPLGSLDLNILLDVEAPASLQAAALRIRMMAKGTLDVFALQGWTLRRTAIDTRHQDDEEDFSPGPSLCTGFADAPLDEQDLSVFTIL
ncbi:hypothetical protein M407DRAFT_31765 [Tulasnella calospora MUT 4182]|uniref:Uncharacterized protein n=1 Tax=Tulasnella calospora MUT 4182 TaxID=1051891 RepID=A0A0C3Q542_9AGAM|nr:hypothetical protein M407DRAFT_31765 [Tulasnella calospora MUT 4182]